MAQWQIIDTDLVAWNISNWVEIFWVTWTYSNAVLDSGIYYLWWPAVSWDLWSWWYTSTRWYLRFYDDWTKIIIMWCSINESNWASLSQFAWAYYYAEIVKSTWVLTVYPEYTLNLWTSTPYWNSKLVYINISWTYRYAFTAAPNDSSSWFAYFNWTSVVSWTWSNSAILLASNIWSTSLSYRWRTLTTWRLLSFWNTTYYWAGWAVLQTLSYT